tara:strand:+ start:1573 stop:1899 length:327 start_codon:yes stop_codon:yes gene_type:complete
MDENYDYEETIEISKEYDNNHNFLKNYDKNVKKNMSIRTLTNYEMTRILSERSSQLSDGAQPLIANVERFDNAYEIAVEELKQKRIPFIICRPLGNKTEYFKLNELSF